MKNPLVHFIVKFLKLESAGGLLLVAVSALAVILANSPLAPDYHAWVTPYVHGINDGLMAIFFLMVGLEIKREVLEGELSTRAQAFLPVAAAIGGVALPAFIYILYNTGTENLRGWAIPSATDIAFSLGVLSLFGKRVPVSLKIFLMALAVIDDLAAVIIIAVFYTSQLVPGALMLALACVILLAKCNRDGVSRPWPYLGLGLVLWLAVLQSGIHATIAGVVLGMLVPMGLGKRMIERMHPFVAFLIVPLFAFANAGVSLAGITMEKLGHPLVMGIAFGLFFGKQLGIASVVWLLKHFKLARLPEGASWLEFYAVSILAGIGFTMSLFIAGLAFTDMETLLHAKVGILIGSLLSAIMGCLTMAIAIRKRQS